jgi:hypothetical protein
MKADALTNEISVGAALVKGACPVFARCMEWDHTGGILERAAEFLVSRRGL